MKYCDINNPLANERQIDQVHTTRSHAFFHLLTPPSASKPCDNSQLELRSLYTQYSIVCSKIIAKKDISRPRNKLFGRREKRYKFKLFSMISLISWKNQVRFQSEFIRTLVLTRELSGILNFCPKNLSSSRSTL